MQTLTLLLNYINNYLFGLNEAQVIAFWFFFALATRIYFRNIKVYLIVMACAIFIPIFIRLLIKTDFLIAFNLIPRGLVEIFLKGGFVGAIFGYLLAKYLVSENLVSKTVKKSIPAAFFVIFFASWVYIWWTH